MPPTDRQQAAITAPAGPVLVLAGPGAGKTYCLIRRVAYLIEHQQVTAERICTVTFTNKAAEEIATRLRDELGGTADRVTRGTLHALCVGVLREHGAVIGLKPGFGIADEAYQSAVLGRLGVWPARRRGAILSVFGRRRLAGYRLTDGDEKLFQRYTAHLKARDLLDFDDLIATTASLLEHHPDVTAAVGARWDHVLVDEFQDLDAAQYGILRALVQGHRNIFAVGDDEQSIFSWRGADPKVLRQFTADFGIAHPIVLDENRRCSRQIFAVARRLVETNEPLFTKDLRATRDSAHDVRAYAFPEELAEAQWIAGDLVADRAAHGRRWGDYALLYRRHDLGALLERQLIRTGVPCRLAPKRALLDDPVVKAVVAGLRLMRAPDDGAALAALAEVVLPDSLWEEIRAEAGRPDGDLLAAARGVGRRRGRTDPDGRRAWRFVFHVGNLAGLGRSHTTLRGLVHALLLQRVERYRNVLEEREDELSDPAEGAPLALAGLLKDAHVAGGRIWIERHGGAEIALRGLFLEAGWVGVGYLGSDTALDLGDVVIRPDLAGPNGLSLTVFKALQVLYGADSDPAFRDYVAFDLETTDSDLERAEVVDIAAVRVRNGVPVAEFQSLVRPGSAVAGSAREVHGYADEDLAGAPGFAEVWPVFRQFVGTDVLVGHNAQRFDVPVLKRVAAPLGGFETLAFYDTLPLARAVAPHGGAGLGALAARFDVDVGRAHHALDDSRALVEVMRRLLELRSVRARKTSLANLLDYVGLALALEEHAVSPETELLRTIGGAYALGRFSDCLEFYASERTRTAPPDVPPIETVIERLGGEARMLRLQAEPDPAVRHPTSVARLEALLDAADVPDLDDAIGRFLERVALSTSDGVETAPDRVNLLTLHATKGLEFSRVYVVGVEDGQMLRGPQEEHRRSELEEARRLLYVGMTRAEDRLVLTSARRRAGVPTGGTRFLDEMGLRAVDLPPSRSPPDDGPAAGTAGRADDRPEGGNA